MNTTAAGASPVDVSVGPGAEAHEDPCAYFSRTLLEAAVMTPEQEAMVQRNACPKCRQRLARTSEGGGVRFSQCIGCGDIWVA